MLFSSVTAVTPSGAWLELWTSVLLKTHFITLGFQGCSPLKDKLLNKYVPTFSEQIDAIHCLQYP